MAIIDVVSWAPQSGETVFAYKFPHSNLSTYTQLIVQESQEAVLFSKGQIMGKFGPGKHTLDTENLPILRTLYGLPFGGKNPFTAEIWFVNKIQTFDINWEIDRMDIHDADYNTGIPLISKGVYGLKVLDAEKFLIKIVGSHNRFDEVDLTEQFFGEFSTKTKSTILKFMMSNNIGLKKISAFLDSISEDLKQKMVVFWHDLGLDLMKFYITSIEVDSSNEVGRRVLDAISRQSAQSIGGYTWQQEKAFDVANNAIDGLSTGDNGILGAILASGMIGGNGGMGGSQAMNPQYNQPNFSGNNNQIQNTGNNQGQASSQSYRMVYCDKCSTKFSSTSSFCPSCGDSYDACPKCGTDNDKKAKVCVSCGTGLLSDPGVSCYSCHNPITQGSAFCGHCGTAQASNTCSRCQFSLSSTDKFCPKCGLKKTND